MLKAFSGSVKIKKETLTTFKKNQKRLIYFKKTKIVAYI